MKKNIFVAVFVALGLSAGAVQAAPVQWSVSSGGNGHYYEYVSLGGSVNTWTEARADALSRTYLGLSGYLATVTSSAENNFLSSSISSSTGYIGGSDEATEGIWKWMDGPEAGTVFYGTGAASGSFTQWNPGEPNNVNDEDYLHTNFGTAAGWNDIPNAGWTAGYFVEYSAAVPEPGSLALVALGMAGAGFVRRRKAR